ncbi:MAG TPA: hypothetical protein DCG53_12335 [Syntrophus sp. (in: bacteria)]|nr:hypothetical protein [Syntrophus sp. (in: bacteria)]
MGEGPAHKTRHRHMGQNTADTVSFSETRDHVRPAIEVMRRFQLRHSFRARQTAKTVPELSMIEGFAKKIPRQGAQRPSHEECLA